MEYIVAADTDVGIARNINQDSVCIKTANFEHGKAALAMVCDGMGGLSRGEFASAVVTKSFSDWFEKDFPREIEFWNWEKAGKAVRERIKKLNTKLINYGKRNNIQLGTTATGIIAVNNQMMTFHVGDTRMYKLSYRLVQLTEDHTFVNREVKRGNMTPAQAKKDPRRNALTQCIGVQGDVNPDIRFGNIESGTNYMVCSDGFRHVLTDDDIYEDLAPDIASNRITMMAKMRKLIELVKIRKEKDNISVVMFRAEF
ncbi:MAG: serine/threonine-protein phosphatase [Ruminococcus sp.]|nr:serine/threonine-protein phosphatase [Ruminococcus sp.]MCR5729914.1 serine/threonine-protein phosphatase [Ruminococcus sp.]